ncbi:branched-chain amino acid ABC transporter permease [Granulicoccus phenolivorans]|uniref:branched-chain amino acid ABC transporter permease n=1 Tax=Granulicoccus phenolivorans TaxID=266854 RepID=UPI0003FC91F9|nr:branched-chain amino acid ABC transporter permease [Granulicoccus phenolivorans]
MTLYSTPDTDAVVAAENRPKALHRNRKGRGIGLAIGAGLLLIGLVVPYVVNDNFTMSLLVTSSLMSLMALGIGFLARYLGLFSLGHGAFYGCAAYAVAIATTNWGWGPLPAVIFGTVFGALVALIIGVLVVRASGFGFLMLTLALSQALYQMSNQTVMRPLTGAHDGKLITYTGNATFFGLSMSDMMDPGLFWPVAWVALVVTGVILWLFGRSRFGTTLEGIRENEERMRFSGFNTFRPRLAAFVLTGAAASLGGALFALNVGYISPDILSFGKAGDSLVAALIGGLGTLVGPVLGTFLFVYAQANFNFGGNIHLLTGVLLIVVLVFAPGGITGALTKPYRYWRAKLTQRGKGAEK